VFGKVTEGMEVIEAIGTTPTGAGDRPRTPVKMERITIEE
jgi:cyclophilin family peptidyl-prolyl cis-trans isomerase